LKGDSTQSRAEIVPHIWSTGIRSGHEAEIPSLFLEVGFPVSWLPIDQRKLPNPHQYAERFRMGGRNQPEADVRFLARITGKASMQAGSNYWIRSRAFILPELARHRGFSIYSKIN